jgi:thioredoxin reductase (NADPH)
MKQCDVCIIGAGPVGIHAAFQAGILGMTSCIVDSLAFVGGQCNALYPEKPIFDIPGFSKIFAQDLIDKLVEQSSKFNPEYILNHKAVNLTGNSDTGFELEILENDTNILSKISAKAVVLACGAGFFGPKKPPLDGIESFENKSVFYFVDKISNFAGRDILIAGGGDSAVDWALSLAKETKSLAIVHRRSNFRCLPDSERELKELVESGKVKLLTPYQLSGLDGSEGRLSSVIIENIETEEKISYKCDYLLPFFGLNADIGNIEQWGVKIEKKLAVVNKETYETSVSGIYAVGDIAGYDGKLKLIMLGFAESAIAMHNAYKNVFKKSPHFQHSSSLAGTF